MAARNVADRVSPPCDRRPPIKTLDTADMQHFLAVAEGRTVVVPQRRRQMARA